MAQQPAPLRVAIIGGGIAGAAVANALSGAERLDVHVFEAGETFSEQGAAVGLAINAQRALDHIVPSVGDLLDNAGAIEMKSTRRLLGSGPQAGTFICDIDTIGNQKTVHRASLLRELLASLPSSKLHGSKGLNNIIERGDQGVDLGFKDGTIENFDAVIGADGIFSTVRTHVLRDTPGGSTSTPAGFWDCRRLVSLERAKAAIGDEFYRENRQYSWIGDGGFMMHDIVEGGKTVHCVISGVEATTAPDRKHELSRDILQDRFKTWLDGPIAPGMIELMCEDPDLQGYSQWDHKLTPTYYNRRCCIMGDAAHSTTPWQGAGAGLAFEDAMILGSLLRNITKPGQIELAFKTFDSVRRPRGQRVIDSSREAGRILCGRHEEAGLDPDKIADKLTTRLQFIHNLDMDAHNEEALAKLKAALAEAA